MGDHVRDILKYPRVQAALRWLFTLLINGKFPIWTHPYLCTQRLFALGEKARPVCVGEWLVRTASMLCESRVREKDSKSYFLHSGKGYKVLQFGTQVAGGMEAITTIADALVHEEGKGRIVVKKDGANAYNTSNRLLGVRITAKTFPTTSRWGRWYYGTPSLLRMSSGEWMWGEEGFFQGDPYAGRAHDTLLQAALIQAAEECVTQHRLEPHQAHPASETGSLTEDDLIIVAFRDDVYVIGEAEIVIKANEAIDKHREEITGVVENREKTEAYAPPGVYPSEEARERSMSIISSSYIEEDKVSTRGLKMVGAPVGDEGYCDAFLGEASEKYPNFLPRITTMDTQIAKTLLRDCHLPIFTHLIRMVHPHIIQHHARALDEKIIETYLTIDNQHKDDWTRDAKRMANQPFRLGGMGMRSVEETSPIAYYAARVAAIATIIADIDPTLRTYLQEFEPDPPPPPPPPAAEAEPEGDAEMRELFGSPSPPASPTPTSAESSPPQPQSPPDSPSQMTHSANLFSQAEQSVGSEEKSEEDSNASPHARPASPTLLAGQRGDEQEEKRRVERERVSANVFTNALWSAWRALVYSEHVREAFNERWRGESDVLDTFPRSIGACCYGVLDASPRLQNALTKAVEDVRECIHSTTRNQEEKVRASEAKSPGAKGACLAQPRTQGTTIPPDAMKFASTYRLGTAKAHDISQCPCGTGSPSITHILSCKFLRGRFVRHDVLVNVLVDMLRAIGVTASTEVMILEGSQKRMDIVVTLATGRVWVDVSVVNPLIASYVKDTSPLVTREKQKETKYGTHARSERVRFTPFVVSTFGGLGPKAVEFLKWIATEAHGKGLIVANSSAEHAMGQYRWGLTQQVGVAIAHANCCMVQEARARAIHPKAKTTALFEAVLRRGHKAAKGAPRAYVFTKRIVWQKNASGLQAGALGERASASGASVA